MEGVLFNPKLEFVPIGCIRDIFTTRTKGPKTKKRPRVRAPRHVEFHPGETYKCIRPGVQFQNKTQVDALFKEKTLTEDMLYIFQHTDSFLQRNEQVPVYEAVYKIGTSYVIVQKGHLKQAYTNSKRTNYEDAWKVMDDESPYWVDRYAYPKEKQQEKRKRVKL